MKGSDDEGASEDEEDKLEPTEGTDDGRVKAIPFWLWARTEM